MTLKKKLDRFKKNHTIYNPNNAKTSVHSYEIGDDYIIIQYSRGKGIGRQANGSIYEYTIANYGEEKINNLKELAIKNTSGLNHYMNSEYPSLNGEILYKAPSRQPQNEAEATPKQAKEKATKQPNEAEAKQTKKAPRKPISNEVPSLQTNKTSKQPMNEAQKQIKPNLRTRKYKK